MPAPCKPTAPEPPTLSALPQSGDKISHPITPDAVSHQHAAAARALKLDLLKLKIDPVRTVDGDELDEADAEHIVALAVRRLIRGDKS